MLCLCSLYLPPQQFSHLRLSGRAEHSQLDQSHPPVSGLCFNNQCCVCSCWLLHIHWLHSRYSPEAVDYRLKTQTVMRFPLPFSGDIFENYCRDDNLATFGRFCFGLSIVTTFPLECFVTREVIDEGKRGNAHKRMSPFACSVSLQVVSNVFCCRELTRVEHAGLTVFIVAVCTSMSLAFECLGVVLELNVSCCFHGSLALIDCSWPCSLVMDRPLLYHTGRSECHSSDFHHSICMLPQALPWTVVSGWKPDTVNPDFYRHVCHDHWFDHDWAVPTRLFPRKRNVLLRRLKCVWHRTACMIKTPT